MKLINNQIREILGEINWQLFNCQLTYYYPEKSKKMNIELLNIENNDVFSKVSTDANIDLMLLFDCFDEMYMEYVGNNDKRFNKVLIQIFQNGDNSIKYLWDETSFIENEIFNANSFTNYLNEKLIMLMFEKQFRKKRWENAEFRFIVKDNEIIFEGYSESKKSRTLINFGLPKYLSDEIIYHHNITNYGILKDKWDSWNTLVIRSPHNTIDILKDVTYSVEAF